MRNYVLFALPLTIVSSFAVARTMPHSSPTDRACVEQLNSVSERIYQQQKDLVQVKAQIGDEAVDGDESIERHAQSRVAAVDAEINRRERAQRSIGVIGQLVYGQRAGIAGMTYSQALKYAQHDLASGDARLRTLSLSEIERTSKNIRARYGDCSDKAPSFGQFADAVVKDRKKAAVSR